MVPMDSLPLSQSVQTTRNSWINDVDAPSLVKSISLFFPLALGLFVVVRFWHLTAAPLSFDEIFSVHAVRHDWVGMIAFVGRDLVHPPLFYALLKLWVRIGGESLLWLRLFSTLIAIVTIIPLLQLCKELSLRASERNSALVLMAVNTFLIYYSQLLRMYSLLLLLSVCSLWLFVKLFKSPVVPKGLLWALGSINLLLVYTHYFGWILIGAELLFLLCWRRQQLFSFLVSVTVIGICFSPWIYAVARVYANRGLAQNIGWINRPRMSDLIAFYATLNDKPFEFPWNGKTGMLLFVCPILFWGVQVFLRARGRDRQRDSTFWLLLLFAFLPVSAVYFASQLIGQSIWLPRGLLFVAAPYFILVAVSISQLRPRWVSAVTLTLVLGWAMLAGFKNLGQNFQCSDQNCSNVDINSWVHRMAQSEASPNEVKVYALDEHTPYIIWFYLSSQHENRFQVRLVKGLTPGRKDYWLTNEMFQSVAVDKLTALDGNHFWVSFTEKQWKEKRTPQQIFLDAGYRVGDGFGGGQTGDKTYLFPVWH
jgi:hypothetical protein